jgi:putative transposase
MRIYAPCVTVEATSTGDRTTGVLTLGGPRYAPLGPIKVVFDRFTQGTVKSWTIKRELDNEWYVIACCEWEIADPKPVNDLTVGIDRGVKLFIADSTGRTVDNPRARDTLERRIARAQRQVDKKTKGSSNQKKARTKVARLLRLAARQREALIGFESLRYAKSFGTIVIEKLNINNMTKSAKGTEEEPGTHIAQKAGLNRAILDSGWGKFGEALKYKTAEQGGTVLEVNPAFTSQTCPKCGHVSPENRPDQATFCCVKCGYTANADVNAAVNIEVKGLSAPRPEPKKVKKTFHRGRKPKMVETAVKPTATLPVEDTP